MPKSTLPNHPPVEEARRYLSNAQDLLKEKAQKQDGFYHDRNYVKMAGHTAYVGILHALDALLERKSKKRVDVDWYKKHLAQLDYRLLDNFNAAYDTLHLALGYDGNPDAEVAKAGLKRAEYIIDWVANRLGHTPAIAA